MSNKKTVKTKEDKPVETEAKAVELKAYVVEVDFRDLEDSNHIYSRGNPYPHAKAKKPTEDRIKELTSKENKLNTPVIKEQA